MQLLTATIASERVVRLPPAWRVKSPFILSSTVPERDQTYRLGQGSGKSAEPALLAVSRGPGCARVDSDPRCETGRGRGARWYPVAGHEDDEGELEGL